MVLEGREVDFGQDAIVGDESFYVWVIGNPFFDVAILPFYFLFDGLHNSGDGTSTSLVVESIGSEVDEMYGIDSHGLRWSRVRWFASTPFSADEGIRL